MSAEEQKKKTKSSPDKANKSVKDKKAAGGTRVKSAGSRSVGRSPSKPMATPVRIHSTVRKRKEQHETPNSGVADELFDEPTVSSMALHPFDIEEELVEDDLSIDDVDIVVPGDIELDPLEIPVEYIEAALVDVPRSAPPSRPKPKPPTKIDRKPQPCLGCGGVFGWVSVEGFCFNCMKRRVAQRKREDETYSGFAGGESDDDDDQT